MNTARRQPPLIVVLGATGVGKSFVALRLARRFGGEIVNADSMQLYRGLDVGTAKPTPSERREVPHHLYEELQPGTIMNAADYARRATEVVRQIQRRDRLPVVVGGTGFYLRALLYGLSPIPPIDPKIRLEIEELEREKGLTYIHELLEKVDGASARRIAPNDGVRLRRALEVHRGTGTSLSEWQRRRPPRDGGWKALKLGLSLPRPRLYQRLEARAATMFSSGILEEARLFAPGAERGIGYEEAAAVNAGAMSPEAAVTQTALRTRRYAKRQMTWFRKEPSVAWIEVDPDGADRSAAEAIAMTEQFIAGEA